MKRLRKLIGVIMLILSVVVMQLPAFGSEAAATTTSATASGFVIDSEGMLTKYNGISTSVIIPSNVTCIATDAFRDNNHIVSVVIPDSVTKIEPYAFWNCSALSMVSIGGGLTEIGDFVFANCKNLASANIPSNIKRIGIYAFEDDINLTDITIPIETMDIHETAFDGCYKLVIHAIGGSYPWKYAQGFYVRQQEFPEYEDVAYYNPDIVNVIDVSDDETDGMGDNSEAQNGGDSEGDEAGTSDDFGNSYIITNDIVSDLSSVHVVGNRAVIFMNGSSPTVYFGSGGNTNVINNGTTGDTPGGSGTGSGTGIDENAGMDLPDGVLPKYTIVDGETVADQAYYCNRNLSYVTLPKTIKEIGQFSYARSTVSSIVLPDGLEKIGYGAFYHCDDLGFVTIPETVTKVEPKAFKFTKWLDDFENGTSSGSEFLISGGVLVAYRGTDESIVIPEGVRIIAAQAFQGHDEITSVTLPLTLESIGEEAFSGCSGITSINTEDTSLKNILDRAFLGTKIKEVILPETLTDLGINAFNDNCDISREGNNTPVITHEDTAERLSNDDFRVNAYKTDLKEVSVSSGNIGVNVSGEEGVSAALEGADKPYYMYITRSEVSPLLDKAIERAEEFLKDRSLTGRVTYDIELTDKSGITITRLGHAALTVAIPKPSELGNSQMLTVLTIDRNGQLEEITPEIVETDGVKYVRFATYHLSPFAIYATDEAFSDDMIIQAENVLGAYAAPPETKVSAKDSLRNWLMMKKFRIIPAVALIIGGFILILYKRNKHR